LAGGEDDVALVLAVLVVDDDHGPAVGDVGDPAVDAVEFDAGNDRSSLWCCRCGGRACRDSRSRSTCLAMTSASRFTRSPGCRKPRVVRARVSGIRETVNPSARTSTTVREIPSTVIEPFGTR